MERVPLQITDDILTRRRQIRNRILRARQALPPQAHQRLTERVIQHLEPLLARLAPTVLGFCWPFKGEPDLREMVARWLDAHSGCQAVLPVVERPDAPLLFRPWAPDMDLVLDAHGILHPPEGASLRPDVLLIPLNAFDAHGFRLGYGGGYFDRTLAELAALPVGVGFELGRVDTVYPQPHDRPMRWIVTEAGIFAAEQD
jgi:5-formyltetrahydrofolate cyclo-ligase